MQFGGSALREAVVATETRNGVACSLPLFEQ
jgi:hypothetical protein